ncbi:MAG: SDR family NAD(P)-dependent oxidoreductase, partial [Chloroflexi bacterium]|nr:SDR family NAD(P)-dependent oxidoreductase [Chloroflexota bacterium]
MQYRQIEACLLALPSIQECAVVALPDPAGVQQVVAYVVAVGSLAPEVWDQTVAATLPEAWRPVAYVPVTNLPRTDGGAIDAQALSRVPVVDDELRRRWEERLRALPGVTDAAVSIEERSLAGRRVHLRDILPARRPGPQASMAGSHDVRSDDGHSDAGHSDAGHSDDGPSDDGSAGQPDALASAERPAFSDGGPLHIPADAPCTLVEALERVATLHPERGQEYVEADGSRSTQSYSELLHDARRMLAGLRERGVRANDRVILHLGRLKEYYTGFWACVLGGMTPATVAVAASYTDRNGTTSKLYNAWELLEHPLVLCDDDLRDPVLGLRRLFPMDDLEVCCPGELGRQEPSSDLHRPAPEDVLFLQLTSGSTGLPKCIQETHQGVLGHGWGSRQLNGYRDDEVYLNWLPVDHVGTILMCHLRSVCLGFSQVHASPQWVMGDPLRWLDLIEAHRATLTWSPNFGYKLVAERLVEAAERRWDLSRVRYFLNGGEQVTLPVVRDFLGRVSRFGVAPTAMQPAFGMAETCTAFTYENSFDPETVPQRLRKSSLGGRIEFAAEGDESAVTLIGVGRPVPGMQIRIVDDGNRLLPEGVIGRFQVKGVSITPGYLNNAEANADAFIGDGWFNTGDLGFILDGALTITGRAKETIVIRGANFFCYEIEDVVDAIEGVEPTFAAACAVDDPSTGTEGLAIFFVPSPSHDQLSEQVALARAIRGQVSTTLGISPTWVVPLTAPEFPKTTSGKIQRLQLKQALEGGAFDERLKELDLLLGNANTLPDWFFQVVWRRTEGQVQAVPRLGDVLLFTDAQAVLTGLAERLRSEGRRCVIVEPGDGFACLSSDRYQISVADPRDYRRLVDTLRLHGVTPRQIVHGWGVGRRADATLDRAGFEQAQDRGALSVLALIQSLAAAPVDDRPNLELLIVSSQVRAVLPGDPVAPERATVLGIVKTAPQELPWLSCRHLDVSADEVDAVFAELRAVDKEPEVAYRAGQRWAPRLVRADLTGDPDRVGPMREGGVYLLTGGAGGIGLEVARYLLRDYAARLILVGRRPENEVREALRTLDGLPGEVIYAEVDVSDLPRLRAAVAEARERWGRDLDGVLHLAGVYQERTLAEESRQSVLDQLRPKAIGALALQQLMSGRPDCLFVSFSSANGFLGGFASGAYAASNAYLDAFTHARRAHGLPGTCLAWTMWDEVGLARGYAHKDLTRAGGYVVLSPEEGMSSLLAGLRRDPAHLLIGLDAARPRIAHYLVEAPQSRVTPHAYVATEHLPAEPLTVTDRFGLTTSCIMTRVERVPRTASGEVDRASLVSMSVGQAAGDGAPRSPVEARIAQIWRTLLNVPRVGRDDNFFELGGSSLVMAQVLARIHQQLGVELHPRDFFDSPTVAGLASLLPTDGSEQSTTRLDAIPRAERGAYPPLSYAQQRLWFLDRLTPGNPAYNESFAFRLNGVLDLFALQCALNQLVERHHVLRAVFPARDGQPYQEVRPPSPLLLPILDLRYLPADEREVYARDLLRTEAQRPFDLARGPLFRAQVTRLDEQEHLLQLSIHHIMFDGWSVDVLHKDLAALYVAAAEGRTADLPSLPVQFADYVSWQRSRLDSSRAEKELSYWRQKLAGAPALLELPADRPRPVVQSLRGAVHRFTLPAALRDALTEIAHQESATPYMVLLAAFQTLLHRYTDRDDVVVGSVVAGRTHPDFEGLIGFFANTLVLRGDLSGDPPFRALVARTREAALEAYAHQDIPFEHLVNELQVERSTGYSPLFQIAFALQNAPMGALELPRLRLDPVLLEMGTAKFDLFLELYEVPDGLYGELEFSTDLFDAGTIERMAEHLTVLLEGIAANPERRLSELPLLSEAERRLVVETWNQTATAYPSEATLPALFEEQVTRAPEAVALV